MTIKSLLFSLFLYVCLVWVAAAYRYSGRELREFGLLWTAVGLIVLLAFIVGGRLFNWWRLWRAKAAVRPAAPAKPAKTVHEDDAALAALIAEANASLAKAPAYAGNGGGTPLSSLPLYLLIGPEGSGKTSTFVNSGLDPQLLAGQVAGTSPFVSSTRLCNLWLAKKVIFAEISGRAFGGELGRWSQLLGVLRGKRSLPLWRRLWGESEQGWALRAVIGFCDVKEFIGASSDAQRLERHCRDWQERLRVVGDVFGVEFPVYQVFTKCDAIPFFPDFFRRLPEPETNQVLGCTLPVRKMDTGHPSEVFAQAEAKRLTASFRPLYHALAERRLTHLAHEPDPAKRPAVYEFPRELKRIRSQLVQFLTDVFRPHPLRPGPHLRGYYLTAVREVEVAAPDLGGTRADWSGSHVGMDGTRLFRSDATQLIRVGDPSRSPNVGGRSGVALRWMFASDLFHSVVLQDPPMQKAPPSDPRLELYRRAVFAAVCSLCVLLCFTFLWSWAGNRKLLHAVESVVLADTQKTGKRATLEELRSLEALRVQVARLTDYDRNGAPWSLRWGLYSGDRLQVAARDAYFRRFQQLLLNDLNGAIVARLAVLPATPAANDPYKPVYDALKTHLMISSGSCKAEPALVSRVLKETDEPAAQAAGSEWQAFAETQIDFYSTELPYGNPLSLTEDTEARNRARQYLRQIKGVERIYTGILANAERALAQPQRLADLAPNYAQVLKGPGELSAVFTPDGWKFVEKASKESNATALGEPCVIGGVSGLISEQKQEAEVAQAIQRMFVRDYVNRWRTFVAGFSVARYASPADAAQRLNILSDHNSPLLALFAMTANKTSFPTTAGDQGVLQTAKKMPIVGKVIEGLAGAGKAAGTVAGTQASRPDPLSSPAYITQVFQPVQWVVPPGSETWVVDRNKAYIESLVQLSHSMQDIAHGGDNPDPAVHQTASQNYEKALDAVRQIAVGFKPAGDEGLDTTVERLLEEPILLTKGYIIVDMDKAAAGKVNGQLHALCTGLRNTLHKYPFQQSSSQDTSLEELARWFAPAGGEIWKFQAQSLGELTVKDGSQWKPKDPAKKPQVTQEVLYFLNRAQAVADVFYPAGATQPHLTYILRPKLDSSFGGSILELEIDGHPYQWTSSLQKQFIWPAPPDTQTLGAIARIRTGPVAFAFASRPGTWGIFRIMGDAEPRALSSKVVEWKYSRGGDGRLEPIQPAPVRLEIVEFPGGVDVFNPKFFDGLQCPAKAVQ